MNFRVDNLQYCNWSRKIFEINHQAKLDAVHATICYHEDFDEVLTNIKKWNTYFKKVNDLLVKGGKAVIQTITIRDDLFDNYSSNTDAI